MIIRPLLLAQVVGAPNLCSVPDEDYGPSADFLFGDCVFTTPDPLSTALTTVRRSTACARNVHVVAATVTHMPVGRSVLDVSVNTHSRPPCIPCVAERPESHQQDDAGGSVDPHAQRLQLRVRLLEPGPWSTANSASI